VCRPNRRRDSPDSRDRRGPPGDGRPARGRRMSLSSRVGRTCGRVPPHSTTRGVPVVGAERALPSADPLNLIRIMPAKGEP
jgi:hypothetical protein